ncbi:MAG: hypothetical protein JO325_03345 [Solirubrobacterales bacterium]|nr:hypothetical protein [Solirubrobacterales bacterium]
MIVLDAVLMVGITAAIAGFLTWAICTQYRDAGCAHLRIRPRLQPKTGLATPQQSQMVPESRIAF